MPTALADIVSAFFEREGVPGVISAYLFGSQVSGRAHRESDIDVAVLLDQVAFSTRRSRFEARLTLSSRLGQALGTNPPPPRRRRTSAVDLIVINDAPPHLVRRIMTDGTRVFCADPPADHAARRTAMLRAADLEPFLRRMRQIKLRAIAR